MGLKQFDPKTDIGAEILRYGDAARHYERLSAEEDDVRFKSLLAERGGDLSLQWSVGTAEIRTKKANAERALAYERLFKFIESMRKP